MYTKGEWNIDGNRELKTIGWFPRATVKDESGMPIAEVRKLEDARLVASAPVLLEALKILKAQTVITEYNGDAFKQAQLAINEAEKP